MTRRITWTEALNRRLLLFRDDYRMTWAAIGERLNMPLETARLRYIFLTGNKRPGHSKPTRTDCPWPAPLQKDFNHMRRNGATPEQMARTLKIPVEQIVERVNFMRRMGDGR